LWVHAYHNTTYIGLHSVLQDGRFGSVVDDDLGWCGMTLFMTGRVTIGPMSTTTFVAKGATSTMRRGLVGSECCN
jgi:hypothetical protein